ncbi:MAG: hypothetical protein JSU70_23080 [Phycisphaerales bacterium]|nr:MAG: hypothetical protein JSU70_23080 [Phycisphaerales bacterium]
MVHSGTDTVRISAILFSGKLSFSQQMGQKRHRETSQRRNPIIRGTIGLLLAICVVSSAARAKYGGGSGVPDDPYLIYTAEQMNAIGTEPNDWGRHFRLMADIDLDVFGTDFNIIGAGSDENAFAGVFDGGGHQIANFSHSSTGRENIGLFGFAYRAQIKSLKLVDPNVDAGRHLHGQGEGEDVGVLVGHLQHGTVSDCQVNGGSARGNAHVGGLVGHNAGTVANCTSSARVTANNNVGGLVGTNDGTVSGSYASAHVSGQSNVGGLVGNNDGAISDCYAVGAASGHGSVGGLVGMNDGGGIILNCYSTSIATGTIRIGGLLGAGNGAAVYHSYWDT